MIGKFLKNLHTLHYCLDDQSETDDWELILWAIVTFTKYFHVYKPDQFLVKIKLSFFSMQFLLQVIIITAIIIAIITSIIVIIHSVIKTLIMIISTISVDIPILSEILRTTINFIFWGFKVLLVFALLFYYQTTTDSCCVVFYMF